jgi:RND family efflux transporter MFP subunit
MKITIILFALFAISFTACRQNQNTEVQNHEAVDIHKHTEEPADVVAHTDAKINFTAYSPDFELFAEADPFVVGNNSNVLSHFTNLPNFTAFESGKVTIRLLVNGIETTQTLEGPTRKGIYSFDITPENEGSGSLIFEIKTEQGIFELSVNDITVYHCENDAGEAAEDNISRTNTVVFTKEQSWKIDFATEMARTEAFGQVIKTTAQIQATQGDEVLIPAKTNGIVLLSANQVLEGKSVTSGQLLFSISGSGLADNNSAVRYMEARNNFEKSKSHYDRAKELASDKIVSEKELLNAKYEYDNAKAIYDNLNENFNASGQKVTSPMNGFVKQLFVQNGEYVETGQAIVSISQNRTLMLEADVQQKHASVLGAIVSANIRTLHDNQTYTLEQLNGKVLSIGKNTNQDNYLIPIRLQIENKGNFIAGGFVEVYLKTLTNSNALTIPNSAILEEQGNFSVFVQITPELFEKREVTPGTTDGLRTEILKGVNPGERVISVGAILVKLAQATGSLDAHSGHVH